MSKNKKNTGSMSRDKPSEPTKDYFGYNDSRKHYGYVFGSIGDIRENILISTKPTRKETIFGRKRIIKNIELEKHPNPNYKQKNKSDKVYLMTRIYKDHKNKIKPRNGWQFTEDDMIKVYNIINKTK